MIWRGYRMPLIEIAILSRESLGESVYMPTAVSYLYAEGVGRCCYALGR